MPWRTISMSASRTVGEIGELVHERDARREHRVGRVLGELGRTHVHHQEALVVAHERSVQRAQRLDRAVVARADDDAIRPHEVLDRRAFLEELGVRRDRERNRHAAPGKLLCNRRLHPVRGADGDRGFVDDDLRDCMRWPMLRAAAMTYCMSALPSSSGGVPTAMNCTDAVRDRGVDVGREAQAPAATLRLTIGSRPGS
jgi:hypothetical protein